MKTVGYGFANKGMQTTFTETELKRFEFYGARALNDQLNSGEKYELLKPVHQIIFIDEYPWNNRNLINHYPVSYTHLLEICSLCVWKLFMRITSFLKQKIHSVWIIFFYIVQTFL